MASITFPRRIQKFNSLRDHRNNQTVNIDDEESNRKNYRYISPPTRTLSCDQPDTQLTTTNNHRLRHLCSRLKRRFSLTKEHHRTRSEDTNGSPSERRMHCFGNYQSFSSSIDDSSNEFEWLDFEKVYDSIPPCLINALPGLDDFSVEKKYNYSASLLDSQTDLCSIEQMKVFTDCKRGKYFRRNALCQKLDKSQHHGQLNIFIQQLMVEKLMRTWT